MASERIMPVPYIILAFQPLPSIIRASLRSSIYPCRSACNGFGKLLSLYLRTAPLSWVIASETETSFQTCPIQKSTVLGSRQIPAFPLLLQSISWLLLFYLFFSFFRAFGVSCPRASSPKVFQVDRLTIGGVDKDKMISTAVKTNHCSDRAGQRNANTSYFLKVSLNESSAGKRGIFKTCQHDWLSLPFCTLSPNHRVAVAKKPLITNCWLLPVAEKKRLLIARLPHSFPNNVFCKKYSAEECFWKYFELESVA